MRRRLRRGLLRLASRLLSEGVADRLTRRFSGGFLGELRGAVTDKFVEFLLDGMDLAFCLSRAFRKNIEGFQARYVFRTEDDSVAATADFANGDMHPHREAKKEGWTVRVTFKSVPALQAFLFSRDQDILNSILKNEVEVEGNLNYLYKFGFMARDLQRRLGVA